MASPSKRSPTSSPATPTTATILDALARERLLDLGRVFGAGLRDARQPKPVVAKLLADAIGDGRLLEILPELGRDEAARIDLRQTTLFEVIDKAQKRQVDLEHLDRRLERMDTDLEREPRAIEALYDVQMTRLVPVGERAREEQRLGLGKKAGKKAAKKQPKKTPSSGGQTSLL